MLVSTFILDSSGSGARRLPAAVCTHRPYPSQPRREDRIGHSADVQLDPQAGRRAGCPRATYRCDDAGAIHRPAPWKDGLGCALCRTTIKLS
jgi:hypothetical protein